MDYILLVTERLGISKGAVAGVLIESFLVFLTSSVAPVLSYPGSTSGSSSSSSSTSLLPSPQVGTPTNPFVVFISIESVFLRNGFFNSPYYAYCSLPPGYGKGSAFLPWKTLSLKCSKRPISCLAFTSVTCYIPTSHFPCG